VQAGKRSSVWWPVLLGVVLAVATGCPVVPVQPNPQGVMLQIVNNSSEEIAYLYVSPQGSDAWGGDVLGSENTIPPGESFGVSVAPGNYDLMVEGFQHQEIGRRMGVQILEDSQWVLYDE